MHEHLGQPSYSGTQGRAWDFPHPAHSSALAAWMVHAPGYHPAWHSYLISVAHLRDGAGMPKAVKYDGRATHEVAVFALDPKHPVVLDGEMHYLTPPNYMEQYFSISDAAAIAHVKKAV